MTPDHHGAVEKIRTCREAFEQMNESTRDDAGYNQAGINGWFVALQQAVDQKVARRG